MTKEQYKAQLQKAELEKADLEKAVRDARDEVRKISVDKFTAVEAANKETKLARGQFDDLKRRLFESETENAKLRGYIARVREDDTVREELISVGDPDAPHLVPKRKNQLDLVHIADGETEFNMSNEDRYGYSHDGRERLRKHWVTY